jgi:CDP-glucose 4,6-dehydratase
VLEPLSGYLSLGSRLLAEGRAFASPWNFGPTDTSGDRTVRWVVEEFLAAWGSGTWTTPADGITDPHEAHQLSLDSTKARERLGWAPVWDAAEAVRRTAEWYAAYDADKSSAPAQIESQLAAYVEAARATRLRWAI